MKRTKPQNDTNKESIEKESKSDDGYEDAIMIAYQKKEPGEWEKVEIPYRKKKSRL